MVFDDQMIDASKDKIFTRDQHIYSRLTSSESECNLYRTKYI